MKKLTILAGFITALSSFNLASAFYSADGIHYTPVEKLAPKQFLERNIKDNPASLDPGTMSDSNSIKVARALFDVLVRQAPTGKYIGAAAEDFYVSDDGLTWTFKLRKNAKWHDGKTVTAQDFLYAWRRLTNPKTGSAYSDYLANANVVNAAEISKGKLPPESLGVEAPDDFTFVVHLTQPTAWFPQLTQHVPLAPVRKDLVEKWGDFWTNPEHFVGNGPYMLVENIINDHLRFKKFPEYWDADNVHITDTTLIFVTDINVIYNKYLAGELPTADIPPNIYNKVLEERPTEVKEYLDPLTWFVEFNVKALPNPKVRRALKLLVNNKFLTEKILKAGRPTSIYAPTFLQDAQLAEQEDYFDRDYKENVKEAKSLLEEAGYSKEHPLVIHMLTKNDQLMKQIVVAFYGWYTQESGGLVQFNATQHESKVYEDAVNAHDFQARLGWHRAEYDQASSFYNTLLCNNSQNTGDWCNPKYDELVKDANANINPEQRAKLYAQANKIIQEETPRSPLYVKGAYLLQSPALGGLSLEVKRRYLRDYYIIDNVKVKPTSIKNP